MIQKLDAADYRDIYGYQLKTPDAVCFNEPIYIGILTFFEAVGASCPTSALKCPGRKEFQ